MFIFSKIPYDYVTTYAMMVKNIKSFRTHLSRFLYD